jgi:hypothetical protein
MAPGIAGRIKAIFPGNDGVELALNTRFNGWKELHVDIREWVSIYNEEALLADGFEAAIIGICERCGSLPVVAYDREKCIEVLVTDQGLGSHEEAEEYFEYNVLGAYVGENTPVFITVIDTEESNR